MKKIIIGLAGVKQSGKDTSAYMIREIINTKEVAIADKLKNVCCDTFNLHKEQFDSQDLKELPFDCPYFLGVLDIQNILSSFNIELSLDEIIDKYSELLDLELETPRRIVQIVGTEILRDFGNDIHLKHLELPEGNVTVTDLRFKNEFEYFVDNNNDNYIFIPLYIQRDVAELEAKKPGAHSSETSVFEFSDKCVRVDNNGSLKDLETNINNAVNGFLNK